MKILRRYIWWSVLMPALGVIGVLVALDGLFSYIAELEGLRANYQAWQAFEFIITTMPRRIYEFLPMAILLGALIGLGMLASSGELTVIRAAGVSVGKITRLALRPAILLLLVGLLLGEYVVPYTEQLAQTNRAVAEGKGEAISSRHGFWHREGNEFIHINAVDTDGILHGVTRFAFNKERELERAYFIEEAHYEDGQWRTQGVHGSVLEPYQVRTFKEETIEWDTGLTPEFLAVVAVKPEHLALSKLWEYITYLQEQELEPAEYQLTFWQKILQPLAILGMVLIAISFIFGPLREVPMSLRLTTGIIAGLLFHYGQQFVGHMSMVFHVSPVAAAAAPPVLCCILGVWLLLRIR